MKFCSSIKPAISGVFLFILIASAGSVNAQNATSSPYSRYGIGELQFGGFVKNLGMGGLSYGLNYPFSVNVTNPASYSSLLLTTFEVGLSGNFTELKNSTGTGYTNNVSFGYFALGIPIKTRKWGLSFGLLPYSNVGYTINQFGFNDVGDRQNLLFTGKGGFNQFFVGNGVNLTKSLSLGVNAAFLFGTVDQERRLYYPDGQYLNTLVTDQNILNDFYFSFGLQQKFDSLKLSKSDSLMMCDKEKEHVKDSLRHVQKVLDQIDKLKLKDDQTIADEKKKYTDTEAMLLSEKRTIDSLTKVADKKEKKRLYKHGERIDDSLILVKQKVTELDALTDNSQQTVSSLKNRLHSIQTLLPSEFIRIDSLRSKVVKKRQHGDWSLTFGVTGAPSQKLRGKQTRVAQNYLLTLGQEVMRDTALNQTTNGRLVMPLDLGFGFAFKKGTKLTAGADFSLQNWQDYSLFGQSDSLANSWRVAVGAQFTPNDHSIKSYLGWVNYRLGFHYEQTYLNLYGSQLMQMGITAGLGFPVKRSATVIQLSVEAGRRGTTANSLIEENYIKCSLGFTLSDKWFVKPKFD